MSKLVCFEGIDGAGKTVQIELLAKHLKERGLSSRVASFPRYDSFFGREIGSLLSNDQAVSAASVDPKSMALWYALDRMSQHHSQEQESTPSDFILCNRYTLSSVVYQSARNPSKDIAGWIDDLEHRILSLPRPDLYLILNTPTSVTSSNISKKGIREYIGEGKDVYEQDQDLQLRAADLYLHYGRTLSNATIVNCTSDNNMLPAEVIHANVVKALLDSKLL